MNDVARTFQTSLTQLWRSFVERLPYVAVGLLVFLVFVILGRVVAAAVVRIGTRAGLHSNLRQLFSRLVSFLLSILGVFVAATIVFPAFKPGDLIAGLGITTVAIGFAFKDILQNFFAGILILWRRPFVVGDEIKSGEFEGVVEDINSRSTRIRTYDGERAVIPNGDIYTSPILVRTAYDKRRVRFTVGIGYEDSVEEARETIHRALAETEGVLNDPGPWVYVSEFSTSSVDLTVYFWVPTHQASLLRIRDAAATAIKTALDRAGIDMPYPHSVVLLHDKTRKRAGDGETA